MSDTIGNITVPVIAASGTFPIAPDYGYGHAQRFDVVEHQFGSGNGKITQRFLLGTGAKRFTVRRSWLRDTDRIALRNFWESKYGPYGAFIYNAPNDNGLGTTAYTCRFANEPLSWEMVSDAACSLGVTLIEIPAASPTYTLNSTETRFPGTALEAALLSQVQELIPLIKIQPLHAGYPAIYLSDRRCTVGEQLYQARLIDFDGISQGIGNEADEASFTFGNADRVMRDLANDVDLFRASMEFSLFHVGEGIKLDMWKGHVINWSFDSGAEFKITAADGLYELNLPYPTRKISRSCWKAFDSGPCPYSAQGAMDNTHFPDALPTECDKGYDTPNGCLAHGMKTYYGAILAEPQSVRITDNSTGVWGFGRSPLTSVSLVADSIYDQVLTEIYTDADMPVNSKVAAGRDESDYYEALGIVGEGPLGAYTTARMEDKDGDGKPETFVGHTLDGQYHHGYPGTLGLRQCMGTDPAGATDFFSLDQSGNQTGGDWRKAYSGQSTYKDNFAAGTAFIVIRRSDTKGLQLSKASEHQMVAIVSQGLRGWVWTSSGSRQYLPLTNPVWIAVNMLLRARGLRGIPMLALGDVQIPITLPPSSFFGFSGSTPGIFKAGLYIGNPIALIAGLVGLIGGAFTGNAFSVPMSNAANQAELLLQANKDTWNGLPSIYRSTVNRAIFGGNFDVVWAAYVAACTVIFQGDPNGSDAKKALNASIGDRNHGGKFDWYVSYRDPIANAATPGDGYVDPVIAQVTVAETLFDVQAAIDAATICNNSVTSLVGTGTETQFKFRGALQEEKPLKDWIQEVLMNCLGYYTFAFGKFKIGVRENSSTVEAFTIGNIVFNSLQLAALKPGFNHLTANFADQDFLYVANSVSVYDIDHATLIGGGAGQMFLKSNVNLSGTSSKSQAGRIVASRLREELGGITAAEWKAARQISLRTTVLALNTEPGMVCSMTHDDMPGGHGEFRVTSWKLNKDYSIDIQGRSTTDSMYDLVAGPKPADVAASPVPDEIFHDTGVPGAIIGTPVLGDYGTFAVDNLVVVPDASGNDNVAGATGMILAAYYVDELTTDLWASIDAALDDLTDPATVNCTVNPDTARNFKVGDFVVFNDEAADENHAGRRSYECAQITEITGGQFTFQRTYPGVPVGQATFGTLRCAHMKHVRLYKLDMRIFGLAVRKGFFRTPGLPARVEGTIPSACIVATLVGVANHFGWGPFTVWPLSHHNEPFMPGDRTCSGGAYTFQIPGPLAAQDNVTIPMKVQDAASIRCVYAYLQQGTSDGASAFVVKYSSDGGAT